MSVSYYSTGYPPKVKNTFTIVCLFTVSLHLPRIITGFGDKEGIREFLFALPRFAADEVTIYSHSNVLPLLSYCMITDLLMVTSFSFSELTFSPFPHCFIE